jgi:hypothetical protein
MRHARSLVLILVVAVVAACSGNASPSPSPSPADPKGFVLRASITQALPPDSTFAWLPLALITGDGRLITVGPTDAMFPGKLLPNLLERRISQAGWNAIVNAARKAGLLNGNANFVGGAPAAGAALAHLELVVDGKRYDLTGDPAIPPCAPPGCPPAEPGTQRAFAEFWNTLTGLDSWIGPELGNQQPYVASAYAILVGPAPDDQGLNQAAIAWPLKAKLADFGDPINAGDGRRCGVVDGDDATTLRPFLQAATTISPWFDDGEAGAGHGLAVRPLLPGDENPCAGLTA